MTYLKAALLVATTCLIFGCGDTDPVIGSGNIATSSIAHSYFSEIMISAALVSQVTITHGPDFYISITGDDNLTEMVSFSQDNGVLNITNLEVQIDKDYDITVDIVMPSLLRLSVNQITDVEIKSFQDLENIEIDHLGFGEILLDNCSAKELDLLHGDFGAFRGFNFKVEACQVLQQGLGDVQVLCSSTLSGMLTDLGNIYYKGSPEIEIVDSGLGDIIDAN